MTNVDDDTGVLAGEQRMLIDGELRFTDSGALFDVVHPASEQVVGQAADGTVADIEAATTAAAAPSTTPTGRVTSSSATTACASCRTR